MSKYLYGASVQGIQGFIFETNKLQEIVGASDLIERFCSFGFIQKFAEKYDFNVIEDSVLRNAGGNIRIAFDNEDDVKKMVKNFPQYVMRKAYGVTLSQAVVKLESKDNYIEQKNELEYQLIKARNQASMPLDSHFSLMKQASRTGKPAYKLKDKKYFDKGNWQKQDNASEGRVSLLLEKLKLQEIFEKFPLDMEKISNGNNKVAVIHADGNKMGLMLQQMDEKLEKEDAQTIQSVFKEFSKQITESTNNAVQKAFDESFPFKEDENIPFRPVVIGGDDVTIICDANYALKFTKKYLEFFEANTKKNFASLVQTYDLKDFENGLTACAGIAFCNEKFPFHYAVELAEKLCGYAKVESKREASCLVFHNIQSSYVIDYKRFVKDELTIQNQNTKENIILSYAPYYVDEKQPTVDNLLTLFELFKDEEIPLGKFRQWLSQLHKNEEYAGLFLERINAIMKSKISNKKYENLDKALKDMNSDLGSQNLIDKNNKTPMADILQLKSVLGGKA